MIYFIQNEATKDVKIGRSSNPARRIAGFQTAVANPLKLLGTLPGDRDLERRLHIRFSAFRMKGEWFRGDAVFLGYIEGILDAFNGNAIVWDEVVRRNYQVSHLVGRKVSVIGEHFITTIRRWKYSIHHDAILLDIEGGRTIPADQVVFREWWPRDSDTSNDCRTRHADSQLNTLA